jgi:hypothetical protein
MNPGVLVIANLKAKALPTSLLNALKEEAHNLPEARELNVSDSMEPDANLSARRLPLLHYKLNIAPCVAKLVLAAAEVAERVNDVETKEGTACDDGRDPLEPIEP